MLKFVLGGALLLSVPQGWALSLGPLDSPALLGQPLDVRVQAGVASAEAATGLCLQAEVLYGDVRVPPSAISTAIQQLGRDGKAWLRVRSAQPVNEPIVTVVLQAGCQTRYTRRYTLLADVAPLPQASLRAPALPRIVSPAPRLVQAPVRLPAPAPRPAGVLRVPGKFKPAVRAVALGPSRPDNDGVRPNVPDALPELPAPPSADGARLQLDPLTLPTTPAATPQPTPANLGTPPVPDAPATDGGGTDAAQLQRQLQRLREEQAQLRRSMELVNAQLAQAQNSPGAAGSNTLLLYGLSGLVAVLAGALVLVWRRRQPATASSAPAPWWMPGQKTTSASDDDARSAPTPAPTPLPDAPPHGLTAVSGLEVLEDSEDNTELPPLSAAAAPGSTPTPPPATPAAPTAPPAPQRVAITLEELLHLADKIAFLEGLGQDSDAMELLAQFIEQHPLASELPYLWWAELAAIAQDDVARTQAQDVYQHHYGTALPTAAGRNAAGLEDDTAFLQQLAPLWPGPAALQALGAALLEPHTLQVRTLRSLEDALWLCQIHAQLQHDNDNVTPPEAATSTLAAMPALPVIDAQAFAAPRDTEAPFIAPPASAAAPLAVPDALAQPEAIQMSDWLSVHEFESTPAPTASPTVAPSPALATGPGLPMLDLDFTPMSSNAGRAPVAAPAAPSAGESAPAVTPSPTLGPDSAPRPAEGATLDLPPLEFDLGDLGGFKPPRPHTPPQP